MSLQNNNSETRRNDQHANLSASHHPHCPFEQPGELSDTWHELLGTYTAETQSNAGVAATPSMLTELTHDPWIELLHARGIEIVDLQHLHRHNVQVSLSELEMEQALQLLQEYPVEGTNKT